MHPTVPKKKKQPQKPPVSPLLQRAIKTHYPSVGSLRHNDHWQPVKLSSSYHRHGGSELLSLSHQHCSGKPPSWVCLMFTPNLHRAICRDGHGCFLAADRSKVQTCKHLTPRGIHGFTITYLSLEAKNPPQQTVKHKGETASCQQQAACVATPSNVLLSFCLN